MIRSSLAWVARTIKGELFPAFLAYPNNHDRTILFSTREQPEAIPEQSSFSEQRDVAFMVEGLKQAEALEEIGF